MPRPKPNLDLYQRIIDRAQQTGYGRVRLASDMGISTNIVQAALRWGRSEGLLEKRSPGANTPTTERTETTDTFDHEESTDKATILCKGSTIKTVEEALAAANVDLDKWEVTKSKVGKWDVTMRGDPPVQVQNWKVSVELKPRVKHTVAEAILGLIDRVPVLDIPGPAKTTIDQNPCTLELAIYDHHFQMLSWHMETGFDYDLRIAREVFLYAVRSQLDKARPYQIGNILFPIGNDFFHVNDPSNTTPASHNRLDVDCRLAKGFEAGIATVAEAIRMCLEIAPVEILWVPGNHDPETGYYLCQVLAGMYRDTPAVTVDATPISRKYRRIGRSLLGFSHAVDEKDADLPLIMANERKRDWAETDHHEWHTGHLHKRRETRFNAGDTFQGVTVRRLPSLATADKWHFDKGYISHLKASDAFIWHPTEGLVAIHTAKVPMDMYQQA